MESPDGVTGATGASVTGAAGSGVPTGAAGAGVPAGAAGAGVLTGGVGANGEGVASEAGDGVGAASPME